MQNKIITSYFVCFVLNFSQRSSYVLRILEDMMKIIRLQFTTDYNNNKFNKR